MWLVLNTGGAIWSGALEALEVESLNPQRWVIHGYVSSGSYFELRGEYTTMEDAEAAVQRLVAQMAGQSDDGD